MTTNLIALSGEAGSGKSTAAKHLIDLGYVPTKFARPLKAMLRAFYETRDLLPDEIERRIEGDLKAVPDDLLEGKTPRWAMQSLGTEWGRNLMATDFWVTPWREEAAAILDQGVQVIVDDCRFANEADAIRALGGVIIHIERPGNDAGAGDHESEKLDFVPDFILTNDRTVAHLQDAVMVLTRVRPGEPSPKPPLPVKVAFKSRRGGLTDLARRESPFPHTPPIIESLPDQGDNWVKRLFADDPHLAPSWTPPEPVTARNDGPFGWPMDGLPMYAPPLNPEFKEFHDQIDAKVREAMGIPDLAEDQEEDPEWARGFDLPDVDAEVTLETVKDTIRGVELADQIGRENVPVLVRAALQHMEAKTVIDLADRTDGLVRMKFYLDLAIAGDFPYNPTERDLMLADDILLDLLEGDDEEEDVL